MTAVRSSQIRNVASSRLLGNATGSNAAAQELSVSQVRTLLGLGSAAYEPSGSFAPASHGHAQSDITGLVSALAGKSSVGHTHVISDVAFLQSTLDGKAAVSHTHVISDITNLQTSLDGKSNTGHTHSIAEVLGLQTALDGKAASSHVHDWSAITTGKPTTLAGYGITDAQPLDSDLTAIAALNTVGFGRGFLTLVDQAAARTYIGAGTSSFDGAYSSLSGIPASFTPSAHTHTAANITDFSEAVDDEVATLLTAGSGITLNYNDVANTLTISATGGGSGITSLGGQTGSTQTFQTATTGTDFTISSSANVHTFAIPDASASARGLVTTGAQTFVGQKTFAQGTLTSSAPLTLTQTWNNAAVAFTAFDINITATAQNVSSNAMTLRQGSTNLVLVRAGSLDTNTSGNSILQVCHPTSYAGHAVLGWRNPFQNGAGVCGDVFNSTSPPTLPSVVAGVVASSRVSTVPSFVITDGTNMARYWVEADNSVTQRNSTNAQTFNLSNTWTSATSFEYGRFQWASNEWRIGTAVGSAGGTQRSTVIGSWNSAGTFSPFFTVNTNGQTTTTFNTSAVTVGHSVVGTNGTTYWQIGSSLQSGDSYVQLTAAGTAGTAQGRLNLGAGYLYVEGGPTTTGVKSFGSMSFLPASLGGSGGFIIAPSAATSGSQTGFTFTAPAPTGQTASTEATMVNWNLASTVTFAAGALTTQRAFRIQAPTYAFASASTITTASTLSISGAPIAGTNATITNPYALNVESGISNFNGRVFITDGSSVIESSNWAGGSLLVTFMGGRTFAVGGNGIRMALGYPITFCSDTSLNSPDVFLYRDAANTLAQRNSTNAQTFRLYNTYTSATSGEWLQQSWVSNEARIGTAVGSAGGTGRSLVLGSWNTAGTWTAALTISAASSTVTCSGNITLASQVTFNSDSAFRRTGAGVIEVNSGTPGTLRDLCLRNFAVNSASVSAGGGVGIVFIANATTVPTTDPTGGGILYCEGGALKYRGSSGTVTTLGPA